jgi:hypothetical protein
LNAYHNSEIHCFDSMGDIAYLYGNSRIWAVSSTINSSYNYDQSKVYAYWYLDVHVIDSIGQNVSSASVTATYPNATLAESKVTDAGGWAKLTLMEKMMNATGEYLIENYVVTATYETYSNQTEISMTGNRIITLRLEDFVIPEFPSALVLAWLIVVTLLTIAIRQRKLVHTPKL